MSTTHDMLATIWFLIIGLFLVFYVILDGFDLGVGILSLAAGPEKRRALMMTSLSTIWDANETWLVVVGGTLFGAFPLAYGTILSDLYIPVILMLAGLMLRGVAFEFYDLSYRKRLWGMAFGIGSVIAALAQGLALGGLLGGLPAISTHTPNPWIWFNPYSLIVAIGVVCGYGLLGATYLIMKTEDASHTAGHAQARVWAFLTLGAAIAVTVYTPMRYPWVAQAWFSVPDFYGYAIPAGIALLAFIMLMRSLQNQAEKAPFLWSLVVFFSSFAGLAITIFPYIIPGNLTIYEAAAHTNTLVFMLSMVGLFIPIMIAYNAYQYVVFRGKVHIGDSYSGHHAVTSIDTTDKETPPKAQNH